MRVVVTGATGQVAYALLPRIASGEMFGPDTDIDLRLADIPQMIDKAKGVLMELEDGAYPLLERVSASSDRAETHQRADWVLLVGSVPRGPGMERGDLIRKNGPIFVDEGKAIQRYASSGVRVVVVGNPCNTNCLIARANAHTIPDDRWSAMTRLDQNRARSLLATKAAARVRDVKKLAIWGNHSATLYPDFTNAEVRQAGGPGGRPQVARDGVHPASATAWRGGHRGARRLERVLRGPGARRSRPLADHADPEGRLLLRRRRQ